jgi:STE24 endopeptidase
MTLITLITLPTSLPWSYYNTFHLEERHGFNKTTRKLWVTDQLKTWGLAAVLGLPFLAGFLKIIELTGKSFVPWLMLFM